MKNIESFFNYNNYSIYQRIILSEGVKSKNGIIFLHGKGSNSQYIHNILSKELIQRYIVFSIDLPGWGKSSGKRAHARSFKEYINLIKYYMNKLTDEYELENFYLITESMGTLLGSCLIYNEKMENIKGLVLCPGIYEVPEFKSMINIGLIKILSLIAPKLYFKRKSNIKKYTNNEKYWEIMENDKLWERRISYKLLNEIYDYLGKQNKNIDKLRIPFLIFHGNEDSYNSIKTVKAFFEKIPYHPDNELVVLENTRHWLMIENKTDEIAKKIFKWLSNLE